MRKLLVLLMIVSMLPVYAEGRTVKLGYAKPPVSANNPPGSTTSFYFAPRSPTGNQCPNPGKQLQPIAYSTQTSPGANFSLPGSPGCSPIDSTYRCKSYPDPLNQTCAMNWTMVNYGTVSACITASQTQMQAALIGSIGQSTGAFTLSYLVPTSTPQAFSVSADGSKICSVLSFFDSDQKKWIDLKFAGCGDDRNDSTQIICCFNDTGVADPVLCGWE